jgi:predicted membrane-bound dolichyl-phosphate-mannose-protein mannosyltransferase
MGDCDMKTAAGKAGAKAGKVTSLTEASLRALDAVLRAVLKVALEEAFGSALLKAFLAVRASELQWAKSMGGDASERLQKMAGELYNRY